MKNKIFAAVMIAFVCALIACGSDGGSSSEPLKKIVFVGTSGTNSDIYIMNEDGSELTNLTNTSDKNELYPVWSPDENKIYFLRQESSKFYLYVMNIDGTGQTKITTEAIYNMSYAVSPDGTKIAFTGDDGDREIYVVNTDGGGLTNLTNNLSQETNPAWSPDGQWIAYIFTNSSNKTNICNMKSNGSNNYFVTEILEGDVVQNFKPYWSPDGTKLSFTRYGNFWLTTNYELFSIHSNGADMVNISNNSDNDYYPLWSPDSTKIIFASDRDGNFNIYLWLASNPNDLQQLTDNTGDDAHHCWSPDGQKIVFASKRDDSPTKYQIYVMNADGSNQTRLVYDATMDCTVPQWQP